MAPARRSILVLEDDPLIAHWIARALADDGLVVSVAHDAATFTAAAARGVADLALIDIDLGPSSPDGVDCMLALPAPRPPAIFVTSEPAEGHVRRLGGLRVLGYVVKPFTREQLRASVEVALRAEVSPSLDADALLRRISDLVAVERAAQGTDPRPAPLRDVPGLDALSVREREVLDALLRHQRVARVARALALSENTVRNHLKAVFAKLRVGSHEALLDLLLGAPEEGGDVAEGARGSHRSG